MNTRTVRRAAVAAAAGGLLVAVFWADTVRRPFGGDPSAQPAAGPSRGARIGQPPAATPALAAPASRTESTDAFLAPGLRHRLEALLLEAGEAGDAAELKRRAAALVARHFSADDATRAAQLVDRWIDYRVAVSRLAPPADLSDPHALRTALEARRRERERHFTSQEWDALFAQEEALDRFTIARVEIARNAALTAQQKQQALLAAEAELSPEQRAARHDAVQHLQVAAQSQAYETAQVPEQQRYRERAAMHGEAAAQRLAQLDREEAAWQAKLDRYAAAPASEQATLRDQLFSADEQARLEGALGLRQLQR